MEENRGELIPNDILKAYDIYTNSGLQVNWPIIRQVLFDYCINEPAGVSTDIVFESEQGFAVVKSSGEESTITALAVNPDSQGMGVGTKLLTSSEEIAKSKGAKQVYIGSGVGEYLWPGLPSNPDHLDFFTRSGYVDYWGFPAEDLAMDITNFSPDIDIYKRLTDGGFEIRHATEADSAKLEEFERDNFPNWQGSFAKKLRKAEFDKILIATDDKNNIVGSTTLFWDDYKFAMAFDGRVGGGGSLGVAKQARGYGIGLALKVKGMEILKDKGIKHVVVQYTSVPDFYTQIGFETWRRYHMLKKSLI